jgi:hypothetical protein
MSLSMDTLPALLPLSVVLSGSAESMFEMVNLLSEG